MNFCIQDPAEGRTYLLSENDLEQFSADINDSSVTVDVLLVVPSDSLVQELPASRLTDAQTPTVQIVDPERNRTWLFSIDQLEQFVVAAPPTDDDDVVWFAMPSARELIAAVPVFRKALVQHSS